MSSQQTGRRPNVRGSVRDTAAVTVGAIGGGTVAANNIVVWFFVSDSTYAGPMLNFALVGIPTAVVALIVCGALTRRFRLHLIAVGALLLASPLLGLLLKLLVSR